MIFCKFYKQLFLLFIIFLASSNLKAETKDQQLKVVLRDIGHQFLLELNDSTSRILAIEKIGERYAVKFENSFSFQPDLLSFITWKVLNESEITDDFIVEVEPCLRNEVVYSFETNLSKSDSSAACQFRELPLGCYVFYFTLVESDTADFALIENTKQELTSSQIETEQENSTPNYIYLIIILLLGFATLIYFKTKKKKKKSTADLISIGQFQFDQKGMLLLLKAQSIELSSKEADLLFLLFSNENKTLEREYILNIVWGDDGDYVGRTLDVFISKLRKKLEADASLKIINIRGVGYKFVIN